MESVSGPVYGLKVSPGPHMVEGSDGHPYAFRITMAAINPTMPPQADEDGNVPSVSRSVLSIIRRVYDDDEDSDEDDDDDELDESDIDLDDDEDEDEDSDDESNGGPSDLSKAKTRKAQAALKKLIQSAQAEDDEEDSDSDEVMTDAKPKTKAKATRKPNGVKGSEKGKERAVEDDEDEDEYDDSDDSDEDADLEEFVVCTLDTERTYQQPLDITIKANEKVYFNVSGTHTISLTGNYIIENDLCGHPDDERDGLEDFSMGAIGDSDDESDEDSDEESDYLDGLDHPRVTEVDSDEDEMDAPKLVDVKSNKGSKGKKRPAEDDAEDLDQLISKSSSEPKLSKAQQKKLKNNQGDAVAAESKKAPAVKDTKGSSKDAKETKETKATKETKETKEAKDAKDPKKVQFAKQLEQGPTGSTGKAKATPSVTQRDGITIDDRTIGTGRTVKPGDKVSVRYIGKLANGSVFDANKKGPPFQFTVGKGEVIKGWDLGLVGLATGGERRLTIPPKLAYGTKKVGEIPANSTLTFDIKLLAIK